MAQSSIGSLNLKDFGKGLLMAIIGSVMGGVQQLLTNGGDISKISLKAIGTWALASASAYVVKNLMTNSDDKFLKKETDKPASDTLKTILLLIGITLLSSCTSTNKVSTEQVQAYTSQAIDISNKIWAGVNSPQVDIAVIITPATWDDKAKDNIRLYLAAAMPYIGIVNARNTGSLEDEFQCIISELRKQPKVQQDQSIQKILSILAVAQQMYCRR